ncbi:complement C3-like isoform X3 [Myxocyprinus asiaticus]|uniref:complement C3-like isoform X3 n=1 Tax=Myxocyprinus asiaticus TaxID=70543 RepID=UPI002221FC01|nr:complement C3-like isoform X3 [Myxocyprinus asiaticus]
MNVNLLWLVVVLLSSPLLTLCDPLYVLSAPNLLRVGSSENVFVEAQDYSGADLNVKISVKNHPQKSIELLSKSVTLTAANNYQVLTDIKIPVHSFTNYPLEKKYVYIQASYPGKHLEKVVMVSLQSGYIFIQTDKPIYTPASRVLYRIFSLTPNLQPDSQTQIIAEIMNPQGNTVRSSVFASQGIESLQYTIPEIASSGIWKVVTCYKHNRQKTFSATFEVKEYVFPLFEVTLKPSRSFFYVRDESLTVDISADYLSGQKVDGHAFVVFGVMEETRKTSIAASLQRISIIKGKSTAQLTREMILQTFPNIDQLVGHSLYVSVSVLTETGSEMVEAHSRGIQIVTSPYTISFKRTPQYFKPGMPFDITVSVTNPDQTPAENVVLEVNPGMVRGQTKANGIAKVSINSEGGSSTLEITVKTKDPQLSDEKQALKKMIAHAYIPKDGSNNYLYVGINAAELEIGETMKVILNTGKIQGVQDLTYLILSKGQIVKADRVKIRGQSLMILVLSVTKDMMPSFRFVAYYHVGSSEVVSDSVWVHVKDTCMRTLKLEVKNKEKYYSPRVGFSLEITGDPRAKVGLVAVDKAVQVLNKNRLTQTKIWDVIEKQDNGCTAGSGKDSMGVFYDAGLMFESNTAGGTNSRTVHECPTISKRRRRSDDDDYYMESDEIELRLQFPETWLWEIVELPPCKHGNCVTTSFKKNMIYLPQSITTWQILAISLSQTNGICVADIEEIVTYKNFFIDLKMPYSAVRNEQVEIRAIIKNYNKRKIKVCVEFMETEHVCSAASKKGKYRTVVEVKGESIKSVSYVIIPMTLGNHVIEVKAAADDSVSNDGVKKTLKVMPEGVLVSLQMENVELNPAKKGGEQHTIIRTDRPADHIPDTPAFTYIRVTGKEITPHEPPIKGDFMGHLIVQPYGVGEQIMIFMTLPLIATHYLDSTNQWDTVGMNRREEAIKYINTGYQMELSFRKTDGSYATYLPRPSSTWLTAYVAKVFAMAINIINVEENVICSALKWLILNKQLPDGSFKEEAAVVHGEMVGGLQGKDADASLTAFVLIAMQEGSKICSTSVIYLQNSMKKAVDYLEGRLPKLTNPYAVAMTSYAMANAEKLKKELLMKHSTKEEAGTAWIVPGQHYHSLEATAYAVLALVRAKEYDSAREAVHWLTRQQSVYGSSATTQATMMVFQAVAEYYTQMKDQQDMDLEVDLSYQGRIRPVRWLFKKETAHVTRTEMQIELGYNFNVTARGTGTATLSVLNLYYAKPDIKEKDCKLFHLSVKMEPERNGHYLGGFESYRLTMDILYKSQTNDATMTILEIGILTGYKVDERDLTELATGKDRYIQKFEIDKELSERGSLIIYLDKVSHKEREIISFRMHKVYKVGLLQPAAVSVYEYFSPDARCTKFYHPEKEDGTLSKLCLGEICQCAEENCSYQIINKVTDEKRLEKACEDEKDYAYKVTVVGSVLSHLRDIYNMKVELVLKNGPETNTEGQLGYFLSHPKCRQPLQFQENKSYLIMGKSTDVVMKDGRLYYILGENTWIEYWPTKEESETQEYRDKYTGISFLQNTLFKEGCSV